MALAIKMKTLLLVFALVLASVAEGSRHGSRALLQSGRCPDGSFYKPFDDSCMVCDPNCAVTCEDDVGCPSCNPGFFTSREDPEWPLLCRPCTIPNCVKCRDDIYDAWPVQCVQCEDGYVQANDRTECVIPTDVSPVTITKPVLPPVTTTTPPEVIEEPEEKPVPEEPELSPVTITKEPSPVQPEPIPAPIVEPEPVTIPTPVPRPAAKPEPEVSPERPVKPAPEVSPERPVKPVPEVSPETPATRCPAGQFFKPFDQTCMVCDEKCQPGACQDEVGCDKCVEGYYTSSPDPEWPFVCVKCEIANCARCMDKVFDAWPQFCEECVPGYTRSPTDRTVCLPDGGVAGESTSQPVPEQPKEFPEVSDSTLTRDAPVVEEVVEELPVVDEVVEELPEVSDDSLTKPEEVVTAEVSPAQLTKSEFCPDGEFRKSFDGSCMACDVNCGEPCKDDIGCEVCTPGFYTSRRDVEWPFLCILCEERLPNCEECENGSFDQLEPKCRKCKSGFELTDNFTCE